jgi:hypothetical protein
MADEIAPGIDLWARANGFAPSDDQLGGATPLLRLGELVTTDSCYRGEIAGRAAWMGEVSIGSPGLSAEFGGDGITSQGLTVALVLVDAGAWPRLSVHPSSYPGRDLLRRVARLEHRLHPDSAEMDERYRVLAAREIRAEQLAALLTPDLTSWLLAQDPEIAVDVEDHPDAGEGFLSVARGGIALSEAEVAAVAAQAARLADAF